jgi:hypothetical protein
MAYGDFQYPTVLTDFGLTEASARNLFGDVPAVPMDPAFRSTLERTNQLGTVNRSEKAKSEWMVAPLLADLWVRYDAGIGLYSGMDFPADPDAGLNGPIDFLLTSGPHLRTITAPVAVIVEAKRGELELGFGQCIAGMVGAQRFNRRAGSSERPVFGASTIGSLWQFLRLDGATVTIDQTEYPLVQADKILGILTSFVRPPAG